jgi:thiol:disulfide interchange protein DsbD
MKKFVLILIVSFIALVGNAQLTQNPVTWSFSVTKLSDKTYEVHMKANIQTGWHIYSQTQPKDAIASPTKFTINANPLFSKDGKIKEAGKLEVTKDETLGIPANQYSNTVDFVQKIKLRGNVKTNFTGKVEYITCDDKKCLPPKTVNISVAIK